MKNPCGKTRPLNNPYEIWENGSGWKWFVLKKYQVNDDKLFARSFCMVYSPFVPGGEMGDVYINDYKIHSVRVK